MKRLCRHLSYANVMASIAVFLALGGAGAFAATQLSEGPVSAEEAPLAGSKGAAFRRAVSRWLHEGYPVTIGIQGDSITSGYSSGTGSFHVNSYGALLRELVRGWLGGELLDFSAVGDSTDPRWSTTGTWSSVPQGPGRTAMQTSSGGTKSWGPAYGTHFIVYYLEQAGGATLETAMDGGPFGNGISTDGASATIKSRLVAAGAPGYHTLSLRPKTASKPLTVLGAAAVTPTGKASFAHTVFRLGFPGATIAAITHDEGSLDALQTGFTLPKVGRAAPKKSGEGADLNLLAFTTNDYLQQTPLADYRRELARAGERATELGGSVLYVAMPEPNVPAKPIGWTEYREAMRAVAAEVDAGFLDLDEPLRGVGSPLYQEAMSDIAHPNLVYHREMALRIFEAIWFPIGSVSSEHPEP